MYGQVRVEPVLPPAGVSRPLYPCVREDLLEDREARDVREGPPADPGGKRMAPFEPGGAHFHAKAVWKDDIGVDVRGRDAVQHPPAGDEHLQHMQADLAEAASERVQVFVPDLLGAAGAQDAGDPAQL
ncbi:MAG: hypothetical protein EBR81_09125 [Proteobacteria bacterium]|nr:hypothetical protein [Pseudomonadota bacterium]